MLTLPVDNRICEFVAAPQAGKDTSVPGLLFGNSSFPVDNRTPLDARRGHCRATLAETPRECKQFATFLRHSRSNDTILPPFYVVAWASSNPPYFGR